MKSLGYFRLAVLASTVAVGLGACGSSQAHRPAMAGDTRTTTTGSGSAIASFGHAAAGAEAVQIASAVRGYTRGLAYGRGARACTYLATGVRAEVSLLSSGHRHHGCTYLLTRMYAHQPAVTRSSLRHTILTSARIEDNRGFALIDQPGMPPAFYPLTREDGAWKLAALDSSQLPSG